MGAGRAGSLCNCTARRLELSDWEPSAAGKSVRYLGRPQQSIPVLHRLISSHVLSLAAQSLGKPVYFAVLEGQSRLVRAGQLLIIVRAGDFVLSSSTNDQIIESIDAPPQGIAMAPAELSEGRFRVGLADDEVNLRMQIGLCSFASPDAALLVSLLPSMVIARGEPRLAQLLNLVSDETRQSRPGRELVLERLLEVLLIEALRSGADTASAPSVARGLSDNRLVAALRAVHARPGHGWTVADLAAEAAMSRSAFFARFTRVVGLPPMEYLIAWRMALAKSLLRSRDYGIEQVAERVGYGSASTFSTAFARHVGMSPMRYARALMAR